MDEHKLPLDLTIYGAIHQQEARKKSGLPPSMIWQGIYTVKFRKVPGPAPTPECEYHYLIGTCVCSTILTHSPRRRRIIT